MKFRAWDKFYECMITPAGIELENGEVSHIIEQLPGETTKSSITYYELMQSTGLKDKNGAEIYEGDVLELPVAIDTEILKGEVVFEDGVFGIKDVLYGWGFEIGLVPLIEIILTKKVIIVGNKYQHPHLLKE